MQTRIKKVREYKVYYFHDGRNKLESGWSERKPNGYNSYPTKEMALKHMKTYLIRKLEFTKSNKKNYEGMVVHFQKTIESITKKLHDLG